MDLVVHTRSGDQQRLRIQELAVQQPVLCRFLASLGPRAVEQSRALCEGKSAPPVAQDQTERANIIGTRRTQVSPAANCSSTNCSGATNCSGNSNASLDVACDAAGMVPVENTTFTPGSGESACCACPDGTTARYGDEALGFRFRSEKITTSAEDGSLRWDATVPSGLAFTMTRPPDPAASAAQQGLYSGVANFSAPSRVVPTGVAAGLHFESGPAATYDQVMYSNRKLAVGAQNTFFAVVTPSTELPLFSTILAFRPGGGKGCVVWCLGNYGTCLQVGPGQANENATGCVSSYHNHHWPLCCFDISVISSRPRLRCRLCSQVTAEEWGYNGFTGPPFYGGTTQVRPPNLTAWVLGCNTKY
jgi:hypothetical protein